MEVIVALVSYLVGSIPTGFIIGKLAGIDVRTAGSGNIGATNVARVMGKGRGLLTLLADIAKGFVPVFAAQQMAFSDTAVGCDRRRHLLGPPLPDLSQISRRQRSGDRVRSFTGLGAPGDFDFARGIYLRGFAEPNRIARLARRRARGADLVLVFFLSNAARGANGFSRGDDRYSSPR